MAPWYSVYTRPRHEKHVLKELNEKHIEAFLPTYKVRRRWSDRYKIVEEPLFKNYLFVNVDYDRRYYDTLRPYGAGGFIGSHLAEQLVQLGAKTRALVHYRGNGSWGWLDESPLKGEMQIIAGDVRDRDLVVSAMKGANVVFHLAALIGIPYSYHAPSS